MPFLKIIAVTSEVHCIGFKRTLLRETLRVLKAAYLPSTMR